MIRVKLSGLVLLCGLLNPTLAVAKPQGGDVVKVQGIEMVVPHGWTLHQNARDAGKMLLGFANGDAYFRLYVQPGTATQIDGMFAGEGATVIERSTFTSVSRSYQMIQSQYQRGELSKFTSGFYTELGGYTYYGYATDQSLAEAKAIVNQFLQQMY